MKYFLLLSALSCLSLEAFTRRSCDKNVQLQKLNSITDNARGTMGPNLANASPNLNGYGFYVTADLLYYNLYQDLSVVNSMVIFPLPSAAGTYKQKVLNPEFEGRFGFKAGVGYYTNHDAWQTGANFTYFQTKAVKTARAGNGEIVNINNTGGGNNRFYKYDHRVINFDYYDVEWTLSRDFFISRKLAINPAIGAKATWFYQNQHDDLLRKYVQGNQTFVDNKSENQKIYNQSILVGPMASFVAKFYINNHWNIFGKGAGAVLWGQTKSSFNNLIFNAGQDQDNSFHYNLKSYDALHHLVGFISYSLNVGYDTNYRSDRFNLGASVGYTGSYYFVAAQLPYVQNELSGFNLNLTFSF